MEWKTVKLGEICNISIGRTPPRKEHEWFNQTTPSYKWVSIKDMGDCGKFIFETSETISEKGQIHFKIPIVAPNTILLSFKLTVGRIAITGDSPMLTNEAIAQLPINDESIVNKDYLFYYLKSFNYNSLGSTSSIANAVNSKMIRDIDISLPPLETQRRIAAILSSLDDKIENNNRINHNLEAQAQALFKSWFVDFEPWGGIMPEDWKEGTIGETCTCYLGGTPSRAKSEYWNGDIPWINSGEVNKFRIIEGSEYITELGLKKSATKLLPKKTTVLAITGATLGQVSLLEIEACANQSVIGILENEKIPYEFIYPLIVNDIKKIILNQTGGAQQHINKDNVESHNIIIPTDEIMAKYKTIQAPLFETIANNCHESHRLATLRDTLLPKLMRGEIAL